MLVYRINLISRRAFLEPEDAGNGEGWTGSLKPRVLKRATPKRARPAANFAIYCPTYWLRKHTKLRLVKHFPDTSCTPCPALLPPGSPPTPPPCRGYLCVATISSNPASPVPTSFQPTRTLLTCVFNAPFLFSVLNKSNLPPVNARLVSYFPYETDSARVSLLYESFLVFATNMHRS